MAKKFSLKDAVQVRKVRLDVIPTKDGETIAIRVTGAFRGGEDAPGTRYGRKAVVLPAFDLVNETDGVVIGNKALASQLVESYPNDTYVGRCFTVKCLGTPTGKKYKAFDVIEIADPNPPAAPAPAKS